MVGKRADRRAERADELPSPREEELPRQKPERAKRAAKAKGDAVDGAKADKAAEPLPEEADLVLVGAGPHALACLARLLLDPAECGPDPNPPVDGWRKRPPQVRQHLKKPALCKAAAGLKVVAVDRDGDWMLRWQRQFSAMGIRHLRSPEGLHPDPFEHQCLPVYAKQLKKEDQFQVLHTMPRTHVYHGPYYLPNTELFAGFCQNMVNAYGVGDVVRKGAATALEPLPDGRVRVTVERPATADGAPKVEHVIAKRVVVARGPTSRRQWPGFYEALDETERGAIVHAWDIIDRNETEALYPKRHWAEGSAEVRAVKPGHAVAVIGGGLTSAHLCSLLDARGCEDIHLFLRKPYQTKQYDLTLPWMGSERWKSRRDFENLPVKDRMQVIKGAREGGSISPEMTAVVRALEEKGVLTLHEEEEIIAAKYCKSSEECDSLQEGGGVSGDEKQADACPAGWELATSLGTTMRADHLWCATGALMNSQTDPLLAGLRAAEAVEIGSGLPNLSWELQWGSLPVHFMGPVAALQLGPDAVNMAGALRGAFRIVPALRAALLGAEVAEGNAGSDGSDAPSKEACPVSPTSKAAPFSPPSRAANRRCPHC